VKESKALTQSGEQNSHEIAVRNPHTWNTIKWKHRGCMVQIRPCVDEHRRRGVLVRPKDFLLAPKPTVVRFGAEHDYQRRTNTPLQLPLPITTGRKIVDIVETLQPD
jgi:hypothetical protein